MYKETRKLGSYIFKSYTMVNIFTFILDLLD